MKNKTPTNTVSVSGLGKWKECKAAAFLAYRCGIREPGSEATVIGRMVHACAEAYFKGEPHPDEGTEEWKESKAFDEHHEERVDLVNRMFKTLKDILPEPHPDLVAELDLRMRLEEGLDFIGFSDIVWLIDDLLIIGDIKTRGSLNYAPSSLSLSEDTQMVSYAVATIKQLGLEDKVNRVQMAHYNISRRGPIFPKKAVITPKILSNSIVTLFEEKIRPDMLAFNQEVYHTPFETLYTLKPASKSKCFNSYGRPCFYMVEELCPHAGDIRNDIEKVKERKMAVDDKLKEDARRRANNKFGALFGAPSAKATEATSTQKEEPAETNTEVKPSAEETMSLADMFAASEELETVKEQKQHMQEVVQKIDTKAAPEGIKNVTLAMLKREIKNCDSREQAISYLENAVTTDTRREKATAFINDLFEEATQEEATQEEAAQEEATQEEATQEETSNTTQAPTRVIFARGVEVQASEASVEFYDHIMASDIEAAEKALNTSSYLLTQYNKAAQLVAESFLQKLQDPTFVAGLPEAVIFPRNGATDVIFHKLRVSGDARFILVN